MKLFYILSFFSLTIVTTVFATDYQRLLDSLNSRLDKADGLEKADVLHDLINHTVQLDTVLCKQYIDLQEKVLLNSKDSLRLGNLLQNKGVYHYNRDGYVESFESFSRSSVYYKGIANYKGLAINLYYTCMILSNTGNFESGMNLFPAAMEMAVKSEDPYTIAIGLYGIGFFNNNELKDYEKAKAFNLKAHNICKKHNLNTALTGGTLMAYAIAFARNGEYESALPLAREAIQYYNRKKLQDRYMIIQHYNELGLIFQKRNQADSAFYYYHKALSEADQMTAIFAKTYIHLYLAGLHLQLGEQQEAIQELNQTIKYGTLSDSLGTGYLDERFFLAPVHAWDLGLKLMAPRMLRLFIKNYLLNAYGQLTSIYEQQGKLEQSIHYLKKKNEIEKQIDEIKRSREMLGLHIKYGSEQKDQQIKILSQENELHEFRVKQSQYFLLGLIGLILLVVVVAILFIRQNKLKSEQKTILLQQRLLRSQMNPHFIFNALSNISNLIDKNDNQTASVFLNRFSRMVRHILESSRNEFIELDQEIENIENYLALQKLRFTDKFDYNIEVDDKINTEDIEIPPMLIQPFVENAIEHGLKTKETKGNIDIRFRLKDGFLFCEIDDDGIGRLEAGRKIAKGHTSMATKIVRERLETLGKKYKQRLTCEISDLKTETKVSLGTKVVVGLPYRIL